MNPFRTITAITITLSSCHILIIGECPGQHSLVLGYEPPFSLPREVTSCQDDVAFLPKIKELELSMTLR